MVNFTPQIGIYARQTDGQTTFNFTPHFGIYERQTDGHTFYFIPQTGIQVRTRHVFVKHGCPRWQQSQNMAKISKSHILTLPHPQGHVMSVKYEEPIDELTVKVWLLYHHPNFRYCTLFVSGTELQKNRQTDKRTDRQTDGRSDY